MTNKLLNIILVIVGFTGVSGVIYNIFTLLNFINLEWMRLSLSVLITLIVGLIIYFRSNKLKNKK